MQARLNLCWSPIRYVPKLHVWFIYFIYYYFILFYFQESDDSNTSSNSEKKQRTGWPEHVWASELISSPTHV